jgi:hypothetical protein
MQKRFAAPLCTDSVDSPLRRTKIHPHYLSILFLFFSPEIVCAKVKSALAFAI